MTFMKLSPSSVDAPHSRAHASVERAIADFRAGRPVWLVDGDQAALVIGVEAIDTRMASWLNGLTESCRLVLSAPRLRHAGLARTAPGTIPLPIVEPKRVEQLSVSSDVRIDVPVGCASLFDQVAIELARLALVLPAVIVAPGAADATSLDHLLRVNAADVRDYRQSRTRSLRIVGRAPVPLEKAGQCEFVVFRGGEGMRDQVAVIVGTPDKNKPVSIRLHSACLTGDLFGSLKCDCGDQLRHTVEWMASHGGGVLLYLDQEGRGNGISNKIRAYELQSQGFDTYDADEILGFELDQRHFDFAAEMLRQIGVTRVRILTNNPQKIEAMKRAGLDIADEQRVIGRSTAENKRYLASKRDRAGHFIDLAAPVARDQD